MPAVKPTKPASAKPYRHGDAGKSLGKQVKVKSDKTKSADRMRAFMRKKSGKPEREVIAPIVAEESEGEEEMEIEEEAESEAEAKEFVRKPSGKKGKKFVENPVDLLNLVNLITGVKDTAKKVKLLKVKKPPPPSIELKRKVDKVAAKALQLESAKAVISAQTRAKKDRRISREDAKKSSSSLTKAKDGTEEQSGKKSVSWA